MTKITITVDEAHKKHVVVKNIEIDDKTGKQTEKVEKVKK